MQIAHVKGCITVGVPETDACGQFLQACEAETCSSQHFLGFGSLGWSRVQAICDFVHGHIQFDYQKARATRTALDAFRERVGVCRDFTHLAITLCRCMNIPARYVTGYLGDIGIPPVPEPMDFSAWMEVYLGAGGSHLIRGIIAAGLAALSLLVAAMQATSRSLRYLEAIHLLDSS